MSPVSRLVALALLAIPLPVGAALDPVDDAVGLRLGVAKFVEVAPLGSAQPDVAEALALALRARGLERVVGPEELAAADFAEPAPGQVQTLAQRAGIDALVVGRTTRLGGRLSVDVRLRSGRSGGIAATYVAEVPVGESLESVAERLAEQVISSALALVDAESTLGPASATPAAAPEVAAVAPASVAAVPFGLGDLRGQPISIRSDELEASERQGVRTLIFRRGVHVRQADLSLTADRLEAAYRNGAKQPERLAARGSVALQQGEREALCQTALYEREAERIVCRGGARLRDGRDEVQGETIVFDLARSRVSVEGGTQLLLHPTPRSEPGQRAGPFEASDAPVSVRAERLEADEHAGVRRVLLEGAVKVTQQDVILHAQRLEAIYPDGARHPDRLVATGDVALAQGDREARCDRAVYYQPPRRVDCIGSAELRDGEDRVRGEHIAFDFDAETVAVTGRTRLLWRPRRPEAAVR